MLLIIAAACLAWGLGCTLLVAIVDEHHPIDRLRQVWRHLGGIPRG
ncbi:hypothetical protein ACFRKB_11190 [Streptomyces scopuliridis]